ncbi:MAG: hypothetical protein ACR2P5_06645 [Gammaproteobacteria bacterium]
MGCTTGGVLPLFGANRQPLKTDIPRRHSRVGGNLKCGALLQDFTDLSQFALWIPAYAGMTRKGAGLGGFRHAPIYSQPPKAIAEGRRGHRR